MMRKLFLLFLFYFIQLSLIAQISEKFSNKYRLKNGVELHSKINTDKLIKVTPTKINISENTSDSILQPIKKEKPVKPLKVLKYGIKNPEDE